MNRIEKQKDWLMKNRAVRIRFSKYPDTLLRLRSQSLSQNPKNNINDLKADNEILKDRITKRQKMMERKYIYSRKQNNIDIQQVIERGIGKVDLPINRNFSGTLVKNKIEQNVFSKAFEKDLRKVAFYEIPKGNRK